MDFIIPLKPVSWKRPVERVVTGEYNCHHVCHNCGHEIEDVVPHPVVYKRYRFTPGMEDRKNLQKILLSHPKRRMHEGNLWLSAEFINPHGSSDLSNLIKEIEDTIQNGVLIENDRQIKAYKEPMRIVRDKKRAPEIRFSLGEL